jgi:hypothetical protein
LTFAPESGVHPGVSARRPARFPGARAAGKAGAVMPGRAVRESVTLAGRAERARAARASVSAVLGPGHPCGDDARSRSGPGRASSGSRSPTAPGRGCPGCVLRAVTRKAAGGFSLLRPSRRGGGVGGKAGVS